jgi:hypothetical protein
VYGLATSHIFAVGNAFGGPPATQKESIWFFDGDDFYEVATKTNTSGVVNANLTGVWAASTTNVWAVGTRTNGQNGLVLHCSSKCATSTSHWTVQGVPAGTKGLAAVTGLNANQLYAVGKASGNAETVLSYDAATSSWTTLGSPTGGGNLTGVYASGADVWVVGTKGVQMYAGGTWVSQSTRNAAGITGKTIATSVHLWVVGNNVLTTCTQNCTSTTPTWHTAVPPTGDTMLSSVTVTAGSATDVWAVGGTGMTGYVIYCSSNCQGTTQSWSTQPLPSTTRVLDAVAAGPPPAATLAGNWSGDVWAVGNATRTTGTFLVYSPIATGSIPSAKAKISGGPVFNAQGTNLVNGLEIDNDYTQELKTCSTPTEVAKYLTTANLRVDSPYQKSCATVVPTSLKSLTEAFPGYTTSGHGNYVATGPPPPSKNGPSATITTVGGSCKDLVVYTPGTYSSHIGFSNTTTYYFNSGVYYFTGGFGAFTAGALPDNLYVIGGMPSPGDQDTIAKSSPCWTYIVSHYSSSGTGTGVEWILGANSWMDVHTTNLELFTREGGEAWEGAQGLSIREVPPDCVNRQVLGPGPSCLTLNQQRAGWTESAPGNNQLFQVDAANPHLPHVFVHGGIFAPDNDVEEFTNSQQVTLGPIDCNSLELSFRKKNSPQLRIEAGTGIPTVALVATAYGPGAPFVEEAIWGVTPSNPNTPPKVLSWWVVSRK